MEDKLVEMWQVHSLIALSPPDQHLFFLLIFFSAKNKAQIIAAAASSTSAMSVYSKVTFDPERVREISRII